MKKVRFTNDEEIKKPSKACCCCIDVKYGVVISVIILVCKMLIDLFFTVDTFFFELVFYFHSSRATKEMCFNLAGVIPMALIIVYRSGNKNAKHWFTLVWFAYNIFMVLGNIIYIPMLDPVLMDFKSFDDTFYEVHSILTILYFIWSSIVAMMYYRDTKDSFLGVDGFDVVIVEDKIKEDLKYNRFV